MRGGFAVERSEQARMRSLFHGGFVVQAVDQRRETERIRQQNEFLPRRRADLADRGHEGDALDPFRRREIDVPGEGMQVFHRRRHDLLQAGIGRRSHLVEYGLRDVFRRQLLHGLLLTCTSPHGF